jgi:hypothetical protein
MDEATLYNLHASGRRSSAEAERNANKYAVKLMVEHLRYEHNMKKVDIHRRLKVPMKEIRAILDGIIDDDDED